MIIYSHLRHGGHLARDVHHMIFCPDIDQWLKLTSFSFFTSLRANDIKVLPHFLIIPLTYTRLFSYW